MGIYYFKAFDWGYATNDGSLVRAISRRTCKGCTKYLSGLASLRRTHEVLVGGRVTIKSSSVSPNDYKIDADYVVDVTVNEEPVLARGPSMSRTLAPRVTNNHSLVFVSWFVNHWEVVEVTAA